MKIFIIFVLGLVGCLLLLAAFLFGRGVGADYMERRYLILGQHNDVLSFRMYRDLSAGLAVGESEKVRCVVDVLASQYWDRLQFCMNEGACSDDIRAALQAESADLFDGGKRGFRYFESSQKCASQLGNSPVSK